MRAELLKILGDDDMVVDVARVSYDKLSDMFSPEQNTKLIYYLAKHSHWSPFAHAQLSFRVTAPIYVVRQLSKTQSGVVINEISGRYVDFSDTYYEIEQFRKQSTDSKQGSAEDLDVDDNKEALEIQEDVIDFCKQAYARMITLGVSKEQARSVLPLSLNTTMIWTGSLFSLIRICDQRLKPNAQKETGDLVRLMLNAVKELEGNPFEHSLAAHGY